MPLPRVSLAVLVVFLNVVALTQGIRGPGPTRCCFKFTKELPLTRVTRYVRTSQRCSNPGLLLTTVAGRKVCARPSERWVRDITSFLDTRVQPGKQTHL